MVVYVSCAKSSAPEAKSSEPLIQRDSPIEIVVVGGGTEVSWQVGDFSCVASASVDMWR